MYCKPAYATRRPGFYMQPAASFQSIFDQIMSDTVPGYERRTGFVPAVDIHENAERFQLSFALPGMKKEDIKVALDCNKLTVSGERTFVKNEDGDENNKWHRRESAYGSFTRSFTLPENVNAHAIAAEYTDGVLHLTLPKTEPVHTAQTVEVK
jgi:HSP20 family protein